MWLNIKHYFVQLVCENISDMVPVYAISLTQTVLMTIQFHTFSTTQGSDRSSLHYVWLGTTPVLLLMKLLLKMTGNANM